MIIQVDTKMLEELVRLAKQEIDSLNRSLENAIEYGGNLETAGENLKKAGRLQFCVDTLNQYYDFDDED